MTLKRYLVIDERVADEQRMQQMDEEDQMDEY